MAQTRNQVLSLFGASPEQILAKRRREDAMAVLRQQDPFARAGGAIGLGLARMFGGEPAEVTRQRELYGKLEGVNFENPQQMRAAAATLASQFPDRALQLVTMADAMETSQQRRSTAEAQQELARAQAGKIEDESNFVEVPTLIPQTKVDITGTPQTTYLQKNIKVPKTEETFFRNMFKERYESVYGTQAPESIDADPRGTLVARRYIDGQAVDVYRNDEGETAYTPDGEIYLPVQPEEQLQSNQPQTRKKRRTSNVTQPVVTPSATVGGGGQMRRNR